MLIGFIFGLNLIGSAQEVQVFSKEDGRPLPFAHIAYRSLESSLGEFRTVATDKQGSAICPAGGRVFLKISYTGYESLTDTLQAGEKKAYYLQPEAFGMDEVVVTAQYQAGSPERSMHPVTLISRKDIESKAANNLGDLLNQEINIRLSRDNVLGSSLSLNGLSGQNVKILIDGIPVIGRLNGNIDLSQINLNEIERVEVVKGPLSTEYGSNALAGTINLITRKDTDRNQGFLHAFGEPGFNYNVDGGFSLRSKKTFLGVGGGRNFFAGWSPEDSGRYMLWKPKEQYFGNLRMSQRIHDGEVQLRTSLFRELMLDRGKPLAPYFIRAFDYKYRTLRWDNSLSFQKRLKNEAKIESQASYNLYSRIRNRFIKDLVTLTEALTQVPGDQDSNRFSAYRMRTTYRQTKREKLQYEIGTDLNYEQASGGRIRASRQSIGDYALFGGARWSPWSYISLKPGLRFSYNTRYRSPVVPTLALRIEAANNWIIRLSWAKGFRAPALKELYLDFVDVNHNIKGNENLKAEKSNNLNVSVDYKRIYPESVLNLSMSAYAIHFYNRITLAALGGTSYSFVNSGALRSSGLNYEMQYQRKRVKIKVGAGLQVLAPVVSGTEALNPKASPEGTFQMNIDEPTTGINVHLFYKYTGRSFIYTQNEDGGVAYDYISAYQMADLSLSRSFFGKKLSLNTGLRNLFNVRDVQANIQSAPHSGVSGAMSLGYGRSFFIDLKYTW